MCVGKMCGQKCTVTHTSVIQTHTHETPFSHTDNTQIQHTQVQWIHASALPPYIVQKASHTQTRALTNATPLVHCMLTHAHPHTSHSLALHLDSHTQASTQYRDTCARTCTHTHPHVHTQTFPPPAHTITNTRVYKYHQTHPACDIQVCSSEMPRLLTGCILGLCIPGGSAHCTTLSTDCSVPATHPHSGTECHILCLLSL